MRTAAPAAALLAALALTGAGAGAARAQAVPTASGREGELSTAQQIDAWVKSAPPPAAAGAPRAPLVVSSSDPAWADAEGATLTRRLEGAPLPYGASPLARTIADGQVHGEVGAEVGNLGYGGYAVASGKVAKDVYVQVGVSDYEASGKARRYRGGYGYGPGAYGPGGYGPGGYGFVPGGYGYGGYGGYAPAGGRSLSLSAAWLPGHDTPDEPWRKPAPPVTPAY